MQKSIPPDNGASPKVELQIPEQKTAPEDSFLLKPKEIKRWADELPVANISETARQTYKTLVAFNRIKMPTLARTESTEIFREPVRYINTNMTSHYVDVGFPLTQKAVQASRLAIELCNEIANSYKTVIKNQLTGVDEKFDQNLVVVAIHRAMQYMGQSLFHTMLVYGNYQAHIWREINYLYAWSTQNQVQNIPVKESSKRRWRQKNRSIEDLYKGYLLLATIGAQRLRQSQIRRIHDRIPEWAKLTKIKSTAELTHSSGIFYVNLWSDQPPAKSISQHEKNDARFRAFDLNEVLSMVRENYQQSSWESPSAMNSGEEMLPRSLLRLLIRGWNKSLERKFSRTNLHLKLEVVVGLNNLYRLLEEENTPAPVETHSSASKDPTIGAAGSTSRLNWNDSVFSTLSVTSPVSSQHGDSIFADSVAASTLLGDNQASSWAQTITPNTEDLFSVLTYNESTEGYALDWKGGTPPKVRVGDMLGIRSDSNPGEYGVGVTRWLKYEKNERLMMGVQVLSDQCSIAHIATGAKASVKSRCLLLTGNGVDKDQQSILTNIRTYDLETDLYLVTDFGEHKIKLTNLIESSNSMTYYDFEYTDDQSLNVESNISETSGSHDNFKNLWDDL